MMGWAGEAAQVAEALPGGESAGMVPEGRVSFVTQEQQQPGAGDAEEGAAAGLGGCEKPEVAHREQWGGS